MWKCKECGSDDVEVKVWANLKPGEQDHSVWGSDDCFCVKCEDHVSLVYVEDEEEEQ